MSNYFCVYSKDVGYVLIWKTPVRCRKSRSLIATTFITCMITSRCAPTARDWNQIGEVKFDDAWELAEYGLACRETSSQNWQFVHAKCSDSAQSCGSSQSMLTILVILQLITRLDGRRDGQAVFFTNETSLPTKLGVACRVSALMALHARTPYDNYSPKLFNLLSTNWILTVRFVADAIIFTGYSAIIAFTSVRNQITWLVFSPANILSPICFA